MIHTIKVFAGIRESVGADFVSTQLHADTTALRIKEQLARSYPAASQLIMMSRLALDQKFVSDDEVLSVDSATRGEIALIPPVSGG